MNQQRFFLVQCNNETVTVYGKTEFLKEKFPFYKDPENVPNINVAEITPFDSIDEIREAVLNCINKSRVDHVSPENVDRVVDEIISSLKNNKIVDTNDCNAVYTMEYVMLCHNNDEVKTFMKAFCANDEDFFEGCDVIDIGYESLASNDDEEIDDDDYPGYDAEWITYNDVLDTLEDLRPEELKEVIVDEGDLAGNSVLDYFQYPENGSSVFGACVDMAERLLDGETVEDLRKELGEDDI